MTLKSVVRAADRIWRARSTGVAGEPRTGRPRVDGLALTASLHSSLARPWPSSTDLVRLARGLWLSLSWRHVPRAARITRERRPVATRSTLRAAGRDGSACLELSIDRRFRSDFRRLSTGTGHGVQHGTGHGLQHESATSCPSPPRCARPGRGRRRPRTPRHPRTRVARGPAARVRRLGARAAHR